MSVLVFSDNHEIRLDCESKFLVSGFLDFYISSTFDNLKVWVNYEKIKVILIAYTDLSQDSLDQYLNMIDRRILIYVFDPNSKLEISDHYIKVTQAQWNLILDQLVENPTDQSPCPNSILVKINSRYTRVAIEDIEYISSDGKFVNIALGGKVLSTRGQLKLITNFLPANFLMVHRSYILNINKIKNIHVNEMEVELNNYKIPFSRKFKKDLLGNFNYSSY